MVPFKSNGVLEFLVMMLKSALKALSFGIVGLPFELSGLQILSFRV